MHKDDTESKINKSKISDMLICYLQKHTPSCPSLGSFLLQEGYSSFMCLLLLLILCQHTHYWGGAPEDASTPRVWSLHAASTLPDSCQVQTAHGHPPCGSCTAWLQSKSPGFPYESRIFPDHTSFKRFFFFVQLQRGISSQNHKKNESSLIQNDTPTPAAAPTLAGRWHLTCFSENKKCNLGEKKSTFFFIASYGGISNLNQEIIFI